METAGAFGFGSIVFGFLFGVRLFVANLLTQPLYRKAPGDKRSASERSLIPVDIHRPNFQVIAKVQNFWHDFLINAKLTDRAKHEASL